MKQYVTEALQAGEEDRASRVVSADEQEAISLVYADCLAEAQGAITAHDLRKVSPTADELLQAHGLTLDKASEEYRRLCLELLKAQQHVFKIEMERWEGDYLNGHAPVLIHPTPQETSKANSGSRLGDSGEHSKPFSEVSRLYFAEHTRAPKTDRQIKRGFDRFLASIGGDRPIGTISKADCRGFKESLLRQSLRPGTAALSGLPALSAASVNKFLFNLSHFFAWSVGQGFCEVNPVT
ncbi:MAG TPA: hypothetical protein VLA99_02940, partial [Nitrospiraceae bacterium]|nr:hypothetical protein [Nitrospiraceae bacterium]